MKNESYYLEIRDGKETVLRRDKTSFLTIKEDTEVMYSQTGKDPDLVISINPNKKIFDNL